MRQGDELPAGAGSCPGYRLRRSTASRRTRGERRSPTLRGRSQLLVYHFMFGSGSHVDEQTLPHWLLVRSPTTLAPSSPPQRPRRDTGQRVDRPAGRLQAYAARMGWSSGSSLGSDFKYDFGAAFTEEQQNKGADYNFEHVDQVSPQREGMSASPRSLSCPTHLLELCTRRRATHGGLRLLGRGAVGPQRGPPEPRGLVAPPR